MTKIHLHDEQFDGWLHAACGAKDMPPDHFGVNTIMNEDRFEAAIKSLRCRNCAKINWPHGKG